MKPKGTGMTTGEEKSYLGGLNWRKAHTSRFTIRRRLSKTSGRDWLWNPPKRERTLKRGKTENTQISILNDFFKRRSDAKQKSD